MEHYPSFSTFFFSSSEQGPLHGCKEGAPRSRNLEVQGRRRRRGPQNLHTQHHVVVVVVVVVIFAASTTAITTTAARAAASAPAAAAAGGCQRNLLSHVNALAGTATAASTASTASIGGGGGGRRSPDVPEDAVPADVEIGPGPGAARQRKCHDLPARNRAHGAKEASTPISKPCPLSDQA